MGAPIPKVESNLSARLLGLLREVGLYGAASVAALLTDMGVLTFLVSVAHVHYLVASAISFTAGGVLLYVLLTSAGIVFSREALLHKVWKDEAFVTVRSVDTLIKRLRKKVEADPAEPSIILTVWGAGYKAADV